MNTNIPDNLMANVEKKLKEHIKSKNKKRYVNMILAAGFALLVVFPASAFAITHLNNTIFYKQAVDLARKNKNITEVNQSFKYKDVKFTIKEIAADDTGIEVIYDVSNPKYYINQISLSNKDNKEFKDKYGNSIGYTIDESYSNNNEKSFYIDIDDNTANYIHNNPVTINLNSIVFNNSDSSNLISTTSSSIHGKDVLWSLKMKIPMQKVKVIPVNKQYSLDIGTLKITSFKVGVLKSILNYSFVPKNKSMSIMPSFSIRLDNQYIKSHSEVSYGNYGSQEFDSIYYKKFNEVGLKLISIRANYFFTDSPLYKIDKPKLPMEFDCYGEKFKITSVEQKGDYNECTIEFNKTNRIFNDLYFSETKKNQILSTIITTENIQFKDQTSIDNIYSSLSKKIPDFNNLYFINTYKQGTVIAKITLPADSMEFKAELANRNLIYDKNEIIVHK